MKTLFLSFLAVVSIAVMSFAQEVSNTATAQSKTELLASKESGNYSFILPGVLTSEEVAKNSSYYVHYFTVTYTEKSHEALVKLISNDEKSRHVVVRFLTVCGVQNVAVEGKTMSLEEFFLNFMK